ncbi:MBL fold metallo-hydrolase [Chloroflexota bacterium]
MYEIYALKVAEREAESPQFFLLTDYGKKIIIAYYFWCLKGNGHTILVDTGISPGEIERRKITAVATREEVLSQIDVRPDDVDTIIVSHLHGDHFAGPEIYSNATFYIQRKEVEFWSGEVQRFQSSPPWRGKPGGGILTFQKFNMAERIRFLDGDCEIYPGLGTLGWGFHTPGLCRPSAIMGHK